MTKYLFIIALSTLTSISNAALLDRGNGLIYDDDLNITWLLNSNYAETSGYDSDGLMSWSDAVSWAESLVYGGFDDWRLPSTVVFDPNCSDNLGTYTQGYNCNSSEMGHIFYNELNNLGYVAPDGTTPQPGWGLSNTGPFIYIQEDSVGYWSETLGLDTYTAWAFNFTNGIQVRKDITHERNAWAVRTGDVGIVPLPSAICLFTSGLIGLITCHRCNKAHNNAPKLTQQTARLGLDVI